MTYVNRDKKQAFDFMRKMSSLSKNEIRKYFSKKNVKHIKILYWELLGDVCSVDEISAFKFPKIVLELYDTEKEWAKKLGTVMIFADKNSKKGERAEAIQLFKEFIIACPSPFFKQIALEWFENCVKSS